MFCGFTETIIKAKTLVGHLMVYHEDAYNAFLSCVFHN